MSRQSPEDEIFIAGKGRRPTKLSFDGELQQNDLPVQYLQTEAEDAFA